MADTNNDAETTTTAGELVGQKLQSAEEVYVYKIPPLKTAGGHRAEDWNLANPLKTCSLLVEQHGDKLHLLFRFLQNPESDPNSWTLFACSKIDLKREGKKLLSLEYFVENVVDSSRYFVVRIIDERSGREAHIGFGFRDRDEATDFRESLQYYVRSIKREEEGQDSMHHQYDGLGEKLKLADGEKIHINLPGGGATKTKQHKDDNTTKKKSAGGGPFLLKKPPPAPSLEKDVSISFGDIDINAGSKTNDSKEGGGGIEESSTAALGEASSADDEDFGDDEDWNDFEGATT